MADHTDDDALGLDHPFDCPDLVSQRALVFCNVSPVSTHETNSGSSRKEDFWFIVAARSEDEAEIRAG